MTFEEKLNYLEKLISQCTEFGEDLEFVSGPGADPVPPPKFEIADWNGRKVAVISFAVAENRQP